MYRFGVSRRPGRGRKASPAGIFLGYTYLAVDILTKSRTFLMQWEPGPVSDIVTGVAGGAMFVRVVELIIPPRSFSYISFFTYRTLPMCRSCACRIPRQRFDVFDIEAYFF